MFVILRLVAKQVSLSGTTHMILLMYLAGSQPFSCSPWEDEEMASSYYETGLGFTGSVVHRLPATLRNLITVRCPVKES